MTRNKRNPKMKPINDELYPRMMIVKYSADSVLNKSNNITVSEKMKNIVTNEFHKILNSRLKPGL